MIVALLVIVLALWAPAALADDQAITRDSTASVVDAFAGKVVWSREGSDGGGRLVLLGPSGPSDLAGTRPGEGIISAKLGRIRGGSLVAVYTRCAGLGGGDCDLYQLDLARRKERRLGFGSSERCSEFAPSIWRGRVAFARRGPRGCDGLYVKRPKDRLDRLDRRVPMDTDVYRGRLAYLFSTPSDRGSLFVIRIREVDGGHSHVVVASLSAEGENSYVANPVLTGPYVYWLQRDAAREEFLVGRSGRERGAAVEFSESGLEGTVDSIAVDGSSLYYTNGRGLFRADPAPRFSSRD